MADAVSQVETQDWMRSIRQTESVQLMNTNLNSLAILVTFLAAVQAQAIPFSPERSSPNLQTASSALWFGGLFIDVLSGAIAVLGSVQLQRAYGLLQQRESSLINLADALKSIPSLRFHRNRDERRGTDGVKSRSQEDSDAVTLLHHLRVLDMIVFPLLHSPRLWNSLSTPLSDSADLVEQILNDSELDDSLRITCAYSISDYRHATKRLEKHKYQTSLGFAASLTMPYLVTAGLGFFTAGAVCFVLESQPVQVWATSFGILGATILAPIVVLGVIVGVGPRKVVLPKSV